MIIATHVVHRSEGGSPRSPGVHVFSLSMNSSHFVYQNRTNNVAPEIGLGKWDT